MKKTNFQVLRRMHGAIYEWNTQYKSSQSIKKMVRDGKKRSLELEKLNSAVKEDYPVDVVVTWVDGSDPAWLKEKAKYNPDAKKGLDSADARYRDWDIFQYWFRAIEKNVPWVRYIHLVTWGHVPSWLNLNHPKLKIVKHTDFIPHEYLPTFSSHTIEANLWRIPDLSEHFIYLNDDMFIMRFLEKSDFFCNGFPKYCGLAIPMFTFENMNAHRHARLNDYGIINTHFDVRKCIGEHPEKWFSYKLYDNVKYNVRAYEDGYICGMYFSHVGAPFRKSTMEDFYNHYPEKIKFTSSHRFRTSDDIMHQVFQMWDIFRGEFEPVETNYYGKLYSVVAENVNVAVEAITSGNDRMICINDHEGIDDFDKIRTEISQAFQSVFPAKSAFEL